MFDPVNLQLFELICHLEVSLHQASTRRSAQLLQQLLHDEFLEIGRSGERYDKTQTVAALINEDVEAITAYSFQLALLTKDCALLTYRSEVIDSDGRAAKKTLRSSIWQRSHICANHQECWQLRFHQGTPVKEVQEEEQASKTEN